MKEKHESQICWLIEDSPHDVHADCPSMGGAIATNGICRCVRCEQPVVKNEAGEWRTQ